MDLKQLEYIVKISEEENITKAAKKLYITQSALNQTLLKLEKEIGGELFKRCKFSLRLTEIGEIYISEAKKIIEIKNETYNKIGDILKNHKNIINIGLTPERGMIMFASIYQEFHKLYPDIVLKPIEASVEEQHKMIENRVLDLGFVNLIEKQKSKNNYKLIAEEKLALVVSKKIKKENFTNLKKLENEDFVLLSENTTIREVVNGYFKELEFNPKILFETKSSQTLLKMAENGIACTIISEIYVNENKKINYIILKNSPVLEYCVVYKKGKYLTAPMKKIIELTEEYWNKNITKTKKI